MNYIELVRAFWRSQEEHSFGPTEVALYFYLLEVCNICHWKNPFRRNNAKIEADLSMTFYVLKNARNKLKSCGLIDFKTTNGSSNVLYTLKMIYEVTDQVTNEVSDEVTDKVTNEVLPTKDKLNETKRNQADAKASLSESPADSRTPNPEVVRINFKNLVTFFNTETKGVFGVIRYPLNEKRMSNVRARIREHGKSAFAEMVRKAAASDFLKGGGKTGFKATFDWLIQPSNFQKVIEGNYNHGDQHRTSAGTPPPAGGRYTDDL